MTDPDVFHKISDEEGNEEMKNAIALLKKMAIDDEIKNKAATEVKRLWPAFLQSLGYGSQIEFEDKSLEIAD